MRNCKVIWKCNALMINLIFAVIWKLRRNIPAMFLLYSARLNKTLVQFHKSCGRWDQAEPNEFLWALLDHLLLNISWVSLPGILIIMCCLHYTIRNVLFLKMLIQCCACQEKLRQHYTYSSHHQMVIWIWICFSSKTNTPICQILLDIAKWWYRVIQRDCNL